MFEQSLSAKERAWFESYDHLFIDAAGHNVLVPRRPWLTLLAQFCLLGVQRWVVKPVLTGALASDRRLNNWMATRP